MKNSKLIIGMIHLPPLPGTAHYDKSKGMNYILDVAYEDMTALQNNNIDSFMFGNEGDRPYILKASNETLSAMSFVIGQLKKEIKIPFGVNYLWDPVATVSLACAADADFAREVFTGVYDSDMGLWEPKAAEALKLRSDLGNTKLKLLFNINAEFAAPIGERTISQKAKSAVFSSTADAICVSGPITGESVDISNLEEAKKSLNNTVPLFANTGVKLETLESILNVADGCVVGTSLKHDGITWNQIDGERVKKFMDKVNEIRGS
jgi:membrane complex biogenesis BtpA family protein